MKFFFLHCWRNLQDPYDHTLLTVFSLFLNDLKLWTPPMNLYSHCYPRCLYTNPLSCSFLLSFLHQIILGISVFLAIINGSVRIQNFVLIFIDQSPSTAQECNEKCRSFPSFPQKKELQHVGNNGLVPSCFVLPFLRGP